MADQKIAADPSSTLGMLAGGILHEMMPPGRAGTITVKVTGFVTSR